MSRTSCSATSSVFIGNTGQVVKTLAVEICNGEAYNLGNQVFSTPGFYTITIPGTGGCDTLVQLTINVLNPAVALAGLPDLIALTCNEPSITLCTTPLANTSFQWWKNGIPSVNAPCLTVMIGGNYAVQATVTGLNRVCSASSIIHAEEHLVAPPVVVAEGTRRESRRVGGN